MSENPIAVMFVATPVVISGKTHRAFNLCNAAGINGTRSVYLSTKQIERVTPLDKPEAGGTHLVTITRQAANDKNIKDERD